MSKAWIFARIPAFWRAIVGRISANSGEVTSVRASLAPGRRLMMKKGRSIAAPSRSIQWTFGTGMPLPSSAV